MVLDLFVSLGLLTKTNVMKGEEFIKQVKESKGKYEDALIKTVYDAIKGFRDETGLDCEVNITAEFVSYKSALGERHYTNNIDVQIEPKIL